MAKKKRRKKKHNSKKGFYPPKYPTPKEVELRFSELTEITDFREQTSKGVPYTHLWRFRRYNQENVPLPIKKEGYRISEKHVITKRVTNPMDIFYADYYQKKLVVFNMLSGVFQSAGFLVRQKMPSICFMVHHRHLYYYKEEKNRIAFQMQLEEDRFLQQLRAKMEARYDVIRKVNEKNKKTEE
jgi:hypothetical protein